MVARARTSKRKTSKKKKKQSFSFSDGKKLVAKILIILIISGAFIAGSAYGVGYFLIHSDIFTVKEIVLNKDADFLFSEGEARLREMYLGRNIFTIDLNQVKTLIRSNYSKFGKIEAHKNLPDILEIDIIKRGPVAVIDYAGGVTIDEEGYVLSMGEDLQDLPKIEGMRFLKRPRVGKKIRNISLDRVYILLNSIDENMSDFKKNIDYISVSDEENTVLSISGIKIKMGSNNFPAKVKQLTTIFNDSDMKIKGIESIDLRFDNAVISPK